MAHMTLSIPDEIYEKMKRYPEIKWSEIVRQAVVSYLEGLKSTTSSKQVSSILNKDTLETLRKISTKKAALHYRRSAKEEWKRAKSLTQTY